MSARAAAVGLALLLGARSVAAQIDPGPGEPTGGPSENAQAAYLALTLTPVGAFATGADYLFRRPGAAPPPMRLHVRFASAEREEFLEQRSFAATLDLPVGGSTLSLTAGYVDVTCDELEELAGGDPEFAIDVSCGGGVTLGATLGRPLLSRSLDAAATTVFLVGAEVTGGFANVSLLDIRSDFISGSLEARALSATAALPVALSVRSGRTTVSPMVIPRVGFGHARGEVSSVGFEGDGAEGESRSGVRFMLGGAVSVRIDERFGFEAGLNQVFIDSGKLTYGLGVSIGF